MNPVLFHLFGPLAIHAYGSCIALGAVSAIFLLMRDAKMQKIVTQDQLMTVLQLVIVSGYVGGRLGFLISESELTQNYTMLFKFWEPGLSILGAVIGAVLTLGAYVWWHTISALPFLDRVALYAPIAQSFGRVGCFFAGCCFGVSTSVSWAVTYTNPYHMAPLHMPLHPAQLYSAAILFCIFLLQYFVIQKIVKIPGILFFSYLLLISLERFLIDFVRADRLFLSNEYFSCISIHQWIAFLISLVAMIGLVVLVKQSKKNYGSV